MTDTDKAREEARKWLGGKWLVETLVGPGNIEYVAELMAKYAASREDAAELRGRLAGLEEAALIAERRSITQDIRIRQAELREKAKAEK